MSNYEKNGAWIDVKWKSNAPQNAWKSWEKNPKIKAGWSTTGEWDCKVLVEAKTPQEAEQILWENVRKNEWVDRTQTTWGWQWR